MNKGPASKPDYRELLKRELETRCARNSGYSLRAFARDLGISAASLSLVMGGKQGLSRPRAEKIAKRLGMESRERDFFADLVESQHARSARQRSFASVRLRQYDSAKTTLSLDAFKVMSDWYHLAILELTEVEGFQSSPRWIAKTLGVNEKAIELGIERLKKLELLEEVDGVLRQTEGFLATPSGIPSASIKQFHRQILGKAEIALDRQSVEERDFTTVIFRMNPSDLAWAKEEMKTFRRTLTARLEQNPTGKKVYCLSTQLFGLQEPTLKKEEEV